MSDVKPQKLITAPSNEIPKLENMQGQWGHDILVEQLQVLNFTEEFKELQPELLPLEDFIKSWLLKRSSCPVEYTWKDLGPTFWPRWIRYGVCLERKGTCSFPTGMHCVPGLTTTVHVLRWQCNDRMTIYKKSADNKPTEEGEEAVQKRRMNRRRKPTGKTSDDVLHTRITDAHALFRQTADGINYRRRVAEFSDQQRRKKRCDWYRAPIPITIDCYCTC